eukprot:316696-Amphidinium_carterae.1
MHGMRNKATQAPEDLVNHHRVWGSIEPKAGAASDESSSSSSGEEVNQNESLTAPVEKKLSRISVQSGSSNSSRGVDDASLHGNALTSLEEQFQHADAQELSESELDLRSLDSEDE